jgi:hypothetical protein
MTSAAETFRVALDSATGLAVGEEVVRQLSQRLAANVGQIRLMLATPGYVLAKGLSRGEADGYAAELRPLGLPIAIEQELNRLAVELPPEPGAPPATARPAPADLALVNEADLCRRLADWELVSGVMWTSSGVLSLVFAPLVMLLVVAIPVNPLAILALPFGALMVLVGIVWLIAGIWRIRASRRIRGRERGVPAEFQSIGRLIAFGIFNIIPMLVSDPVAAVITICPMLAFDFIIRDRILTHRAMFEAVPTMPAEAFVNWNTPIRAGDGPKGSDDPVWVYRTPTGFAFIDQDLHCALVEGWETNYFATAKDCAAHMRRKFDFPEVTDPGERQRLIAEHRNVLAELARRFGA